MSTAPTGVSDAGLSEAIMRDLGMTLEEFNAAGDQGKRAADAVSVLRGLPGYLGTSLKDGRIMVAGSGPELQAKIDELNGAGTAVGDEFVLVIPDGAPDVAAGPGAAGPAATGPAAAAAAPELLATSTEQLYQAYLREVGASGLQAVAYANGSFIIRTGGINIPESGLQRVLAGPAQPKVSASEFVAKYANVTLEKGEPIASQEDFFGGQGYYINRWNVCSAGFSAFSPSGAPLVLTAGHCANDGTSSLAEVALPAGEPAGGATVPRSPTGVLGTFGFSQFGGPNNTRITGDEANPGNVGTDIAVIESIRSDLNLEPAVTQWDDPANLGSTAVKIVGTASPFQGQAVCRSGRTEGWSCGTVDEIGIYVVGGRSGAPADLRAFRGFLSNAVQSSGGDSGGPWISGNFAVGTHSAGDAAGSTQNFAIATTLEDAMTRLPGVQLRLFLNKPVLTSPTASGDLAAGQLITGQVPAAPASVVAANSKVRITISGHAPLEVPVDASGQWSFTAPAHAGRFEFSAETVNGFSASGASTFEVAVTPTDLPAPVVVTPAEHAVLTSLERIDGTGTPGATVRLSGDASGSGVVGLDGHWSIAVTGAPAFGSLTVTAVQTAPGTQDGPAAVRSFTVVPPAPEVTNIRDGQSIEQSSVPQTITGTAPPSASLVLPAGDAGVGSGELPDTGASAVLPTAGIAGGALLIGGLLLVLVRRRTRQQV